MLRRYVEQILGIYNYIDGIIVTNNKGIVEYYTNYRPDINNLKESDVIGRHILSVYPTLTEKTSSIMRVLDTGKSIFNEFQTLTSYKGQIINAINSTLLIKDNENTIGAVDVSRYVDDCYQRQDIVLSIKNNELKKSLYTVDDIITCSPIVNDIKEKIKKISKTDSTVLIYGETGTGKELVAQSIHTCSNRKNKRFVSQNCAAIPSTLLESILFGTTKGSYTGAENRPGLFEIANGGTLFLDEINSMEISVQAKILKAIEEKKITRIGGVESIETDIKIISAINESPSICLKEKKLREDLFYRLSVVQLDLPPLRERQEDIKYLIRYFIDDLNIKMNRNIIDISEDVEKIFREYSWPGNVREIKNIIEGAFNLTSTRIIQKKDLPEYIYRNSGNSYDLDLESNISLSEAVKNYEKKLIINAIKSSKKLTDASKKLKITKQNLYYKMEKYELDKNNKFI